jgi:hypothetical protein
MNERIKELAEQATTEEQDGFRYFDKKKFAELIVRKCAEVVTGAVDHREPASTYADKIKQHFGVEE